MKTQTKTIGLIIGILAAIVLMLPLFSVTAKTQDAQLQAAPASSTEGFDNVSPLVIPAAAFRSDGWDPVDDTMFYFLGGYMRGDDNLYGCVQAPAYLPQGAYIYNMFASVYDNDPASSISVTLWRKYTYGSDWGFQMANVQTTMDATGIQVLGDTTINYPRQVAPFRYAYYVTTCINSPEERLYSIRLWYNYIETEPVFLPMVAKN